MAKTDEVKDTAVSTEAKGARRGAPKGSKAQPGDRRLKETNPGMTIMRVTVDEGLVIPSREVKASRKTAQHAALAEASALGMSGLPAREWAAREKGIVFADENVSTQAMAADLLTAVYSGTAPKFAENAEVLENYRASASTTAAPRGKKVPETV